MSSPATAISSGSSGSSGKQQPPPPISTAVPVHHHQGDVEEAAGLMAVATNDDASGGGAKKGSSLQQQEQRRQISREAFGIEGDGGGGSAEGGGEGVEEVFVHGEVQPDADGAYRDVWFGRAFLLNVAGVIVAAGVLSRYAFAGSGGSSDAGAASSSSSSSSSGTDGSSSAQDGDYDWGSDGGNGGRSGFNGGAFVFVAAVTLATAFAATSLALGAMMKYSQSIVKLAFAAAPILLLALSVLLSVLMLATGDDSDEATNAAIHMISWAVFYGAVSACLYLCYRRYIPFAASTLHAAATAIEYHRSLYLVALGGLVLNYAFAAVWLLAVVGMFAYSDAQGKVPCSQVGLTPSDGYASGSMCDKNPPNPAAIVALILSLYWTSQTIKNFVHTTTAGVVGSWWFSGFGDHTSFFSRDVADSLWRTATYSFGSVCMGSLLVAIVKTMESMARGSGRNGGRGGGSLLACVCECLLLFLRRWLQYFNSWAFVYVGLYGYDYVTAGKNVLTLFKTKGWSSFVSDRLVYRVLSSVNLAVGILCGGAAAFADIVAGPVVADDADGSHIIAFFCGLFFGLVMSSVALFVVESAVRTVIVCFAESPAEFREHHPALCEEMLDGWSQSYPEVDSLRNLLVVQQGEGSGTDMRQHQQQQRLPEASVITTQPDFHNC